jgi:tRNA threonylcarbamoyladenosine biosynthesis protein TsaB
MRRINLCAADCGGYVRILGELSLDVGTRQSELLPLSVQILLDHVGGAIEDLASIAVTVGPGYYTGIRVGMSYASALAASLGIRVTPISTLYAAAFGVLECVRPGPDTWVAPVIPAGRDSVYAAIYSMGEDRVETVLEPSFIGTEELSARLDRSEGFDIAVAADDASLFKSRFKNCRFISPVPNIGPNMIKISRGLESADPAELRAVYLRNPC